MTSSTQPRSSGDVLGEPAFRSVLCGIERSRSDAETARQAAVLAGPGSVRLVSAWYDAGVGLAARTTMSEKSASTALAKARHAAQLVSPRVDAETIRREDLAEVLLELAPEHDLVVVGDHGTERPVGIVLGSVMTSLAHRATVPLLVARPADRTFPRHVLVASDGSDSAHAAVRLAVRIARQHGAKISVVHAGTDLGGPQRHGFARDSATLWVELGTEPTIVYERGDVAEGIARAAASENADLVVVGARGLTGVRALGSVSERVVHEAPCSVLVARHP
jgi:nucleotide-binding universal stress UspA family protein